MKSRRRGKCTPGRPGAPYVCSNCGAECQHAIWEGMLLARGEGVCPGCKKWSEFAVKIEDEKEQVA